MKMAITKIPETKTKIVFAELLAPAGSPEALDAAIGEGADAVYLGLKDFNARMRSVNFTYSQFEGTLRSLHRMGRKLYVTVNTVFEQRETDRVYQLLKYLDALGPDGILVQDFGIVTLARDNFPSLKLHASTQMNISSAKGVNLLSRYGFSRVVLARELSLDEIQAIRSNTNMELEIFIHGALCISISGLCLFSSYLGGKSANRGMCTQACRRFYTAYKGKNFDEGLQDEASGGYYFSPADLELIELIPDLVKAGVNSFKIEGRMKSAEYVGTVVSAYRLVMDNLEAGEEKLKEIIAEAKAILKNDFARQKTVYLINGSGDGKSVSYDWLNPKQDGGTGIPLGTLLRVKGSGETKAALISPGILAPLVGDSVRLHKADDSGRVSHKISAVEDCQNGNRWISIPEGFSPGDAVYLIQTRAMTKRYAPVSRSSASGRSCGPGRERAPSPNTEGTGKEKTQSRNKTRADLPAGFYAMVSRIEDLYVLQSSRPAKVILTYSRQLAKRLLGRKEVLPFPDRDIIISLDPFFPQEKDRELTEEIPALMEKGYTRFILNNLGHFSLFRKMAEVKAANSREAVLIAGPWLYAFNKWAWKFIAYCGAEYCVSPLENNRQNLEKTFPDEDQVRLRRSRVFVTIFARPSLFRIRQDLGAFYRFENFTGNRGETFRLAPAPEGSLVFPWEPFSIVDKTPFLRESGFCRFILDFSSGPLKKAEYRNIMEAANQAVPFPGTNRFNWKNGFYRKETSGTAD
jgi:putative protease